MEITSNHVSARIPADIVELILSYTSYISYHAGVCKCMYEVSMRRFSEWKDLLEQRYPCWDIPKKHPQLGLSEQQRQILKFHLNKAALASDWDIFKYILNPQSEEEQIIVDAHNLCILFNNDKLAFYLYKYVKTDKMRKQLYPSRYHDEWKPSWRYPTCRAWIFAYRNSYYTDTPDMEIEQMLQSDYCTKPMIERFLFLINDYMIIYLPTKLSNIVLYSYTVYKGLLFTGETKTTPSMELASYISNGMQINKKQLQRKAMQH